MIRLRSFIAHHAGQFLSRHAQAQHRASVKERARMMREQMGLPPLKALK